MLHHHLRRQAQRRPEAIALEHGADAVSYARLDVLADRFAAALQDLGCLPGDRVAIALPKQPLTYAAILGTLRAGCAYVPLDPASPAARNARMIESADPRCVVGVGGAATATGELLRSARAAGRRTILLDGQPVSDGVGVAAPGRHEDAPGDEIPVDLTLQDVLTGTSSPREPEHDAARAAYILFTSGSTGEPKGVVVTHANVQAFLDWAVPWFGIEPGDRLSGHPPLQFDLSVFDIFGALAAGATLCPVDPELNLLPHRLVAFMRERRLTQWFSVPTVFNLIARFDALANGGMPELKRVLWCGEVMPVPTLRYWMEHVPTASYTNLYGPTEATIASSHHAVRACPTEDVADIPIGRACDGEELWVLDAAGRVCSAGEIGDLHIGGAGVSPGYWGDEARTAAAFPTVRLPDGREERLYRTGDLASWGADGELRFHGRSDTQIKSRGHRIELGEIEAAVVTSPAVAAAAVVAIDSGEPDGRTICCAHVRAVVTQRTAAEDDAGAASLRAHLASRLPSYMIPARWLELDELPRNANGKVDRPALRRMFETAGA